MEDFDSEPCQENPGVWGEAPVQRHVLSGLAIEFAQFNHPKRQRYSRDLQRKYGRLNLVASIPEAW